MKNTKKILWIAFLVFTANVYAQSAAGVAECKIHLEQVKATAEKYQNFSPGLLNEIQGNSSRYSNELNELRSLLGSRNFSNFTVSYKAGAEISASLKVQYISQVYTTLEKLVNIIDNKIRMLHEAETQEDLNARMASIQKKTKQLIDYINLNIENIE